METYKTLTQSCFSCLAASSLGWPSFQAVNPVLQVASLVPIVPPVNVKLVPSENVYVPSVALQRGMQMRSEKEWTREREREQNTCCRWRLKNKIMSLPNFLSNLSSRILMTNQATVPVIKPDPVFKRAGIKRVQRIKDCCGLRSS